MCEQVQQSGGKIVFCDLYGDPRPEEYRVVETQTRENVIDLLHRAGIEAGSEFKKYSEAKRIIFRGLFINTNEYERIIGYVANYLGL